MAICIYCRKRLTRKNWRNKRELEKVRTLNKRKVWRELEKVRRELEKVRTQVWRELEEVRALTERKVWRELEKVRRELEKVRRELEKVRTQVWRELSINEDITSKIWPKVNLSLKNNFYLIIKSYLDRNENLKIETISLNILLFYIYY